MPNSGAKRKKIDISAPRTPRMREPNTTEKFTTLAPGRNWQSENTSLNSAALIQRRFSTTMRYAHGKVPPKPDSDIARNARKSWESVGASGAESETSAIAETYPHLRWG